MTVLQAPSIILPRVAPGGFETETINDLVTHISIEFPVEIFQEKQIHVVATEVAAPATVPGNLWCWIELSPWPSVNNAMWAAPLPANVAYWAAIGGGGGALAPVAPLIEVATGVDGTVHSMLIPWVQHSVWARLVVQTPVSATPLTSFWLVQAIVSGKGG